MEPREFVCIDCHTTVYSWGGIDDRCAVCQWIYLQSNLTEEEIKEIRIMTATPILEDDDD